jgi:hypothetical protein
MGGGADLPRKQMESGLEPVFLYKILRFCPKNNFSAKQAVKVDKFQNVFLRKAKLNSAKIFANVQKRKLSLQQ